MSKHKEITFETEIVDYLTQHEWIEGTSEGYDKALALYPEDLITYIKTTQPKEYEKFEKRHPGNTDAALCKHVASQMDKQGSLYFLRHELKEINARFKLCQFKPDLHSDTLVEKYNKNILRVVRQVYYSEHNKNSIDLVLFLNGIPVATIELKTDFTQNIQDAINQYKYNRNPKDPKTKHEEPLLAFKKRALVHFAVSTDEVHMTTHLKGKDTFFLPFNKGNDGAAGNPPNPNGYATSYLWEEVLSKDTWLKILGRYIHLEVKDKEDFTGKKYKSETMIFPRYHQLDVTSQLIADAKENGAGEHYLIQHSAGSGKSNSIAWLAHQLSSLHNAKNEQVFNSVIVITDRTVLDSQLQETISQFEHKDGVVVRINRENGDGSKSEQLTSALERSAAIIIVTIQTFPFIIEAIRERTTLKGKAYAIIADEAHSSQTGMTAKKLREVLTAEQIEEGEEITAEDMLLATLASRSQSANISYFAFTATPKAKTLEMFGKLPNPTQVASEDNTPQAFHVYTMQQAIEEGFIIDVLKSYTTYDLAYKLATAEGDDKEVDTSKAKVQLARWVRLHPYNISQKIEIIIEHFRTHIAHLLDGKAKAMVVTSSRKEAVRYKVALDQYIKDNSYAGLQAMVAFSGKVEDDGEGMLKEYTESSMNPGLKGRDMRKAFDSDDYQVMLVANKFQTGFDQPKLCAMYVDKKLSGVEAVQTLSRLNRTYPGKEVVFVLDFFNDAEEIKEAFDPYYTTATLTNVSDPNMIFELQMKLDANNIYTQNEVEQFAQAYFDPKGLQEAMSAAVKPAADRYKSRYKTALESMKAANLALEYAIENKDESGIHNAELDIKHAKEDKDTLELFKKDLGTFVRMYEFLSQIVDYEDADLEKLCVFARGLIPNLKVIDLTPPIDISSVEMTHYSIRNKKVQKIDLKGGTIDPDGPGGGVARDPETDTIAHVVNAMNELFAGELTDNDKLNYARAIKDKVMENVQVTQQLQSNSKEQAMLGDFPVAMMDAIIGSMGAHENMAKQVLTEDKVKDGFARLLLDMIYSDMGAI
jgi:type I restriction enzyme, R subunit